MSSEFSKIRHDQVYVLAVGGIPVTFGRIFGPGNNVIYAAALSEQDLRRESCGYGVTEAEASADLFRLMR